MADRYWVLGTGTWSRTNTTNWSASSGGVGGASVPTASDNVYFDANSNVLATAFTVTMANLPRVCNDFLASGLDGVMTLAGASIGLTVSGSLTFQATNFTRTYTGATTFNATTTGKTVTTNGVAFGGAVTFNGVGGGWTLGSALTTGGTNTTTLTNGTLDLQSYTLSTGLFNSSNLNTRTIAFGTGQISCTGTGTVWTTSTVTGLTTTGTQVVNVTSTGSTAITVNTGPLSEANSISFNFTGGTYALSVFGNVLGNSYRNLDFTGYAGTISLIYVGTIYGNLTISSGMTLPSTTSVMTFGATSGTQQITTNAKTLDFPLTFNGVGGTFQLQDALTMGSTRTATLTRGTLDLQSYTLSTGLFSSSNSNTRTIAFGTGQISCTGTGTVWSTSNQTNLTTTGTQVVNVTSVGSTAISVFTGSLSELNSISFNFTGGTYALSSFLGTAANTARNVNFTGYAGTFPGTADVTIYGNLTFSSGMTLNSVGNNLTFGATSGTQTITSNAKTMDFPITINGNSATTVTCADALTLGSTRALTFSLGTLKLAAGTTSTVGSFVTSGTTLKYLQSTTPGTQATISDASGTNTATYLSIQDSAATGGATWDATAATNVDAGNNSGWTFGAAPTATGNFLMFF